MPVASCFHGTSTDKWSSWCKCFASNGFSLVRKPQVSKGSAASRLVWAEGGGFKVQQGMNPSIAMWILLGRVSPLRFMSTVGKGAAILYRLDLHGEEGQSTANVQTVLRQPGH